MANYTDTPCVVTLTITDSVGAAADVTTLTAYLRDPKNVEQIYVQGASGTWTHPGTGSYTFSFTPDKIGEWRVGFTGVDVAFTCVNTTQIAVTTLRPFD